MVAFGVEQLVNGPAHPWLDTELDRDLSALKPN
jgi:hypothetical protein